MGCLHIRMRQTRSVIFFFFGVSDSLFKLCSELRMQLKDELGVYIHFVLEGAAPVSRYVRFSPMHLTHVHIEGAALSEGLPAVLAKEVLGRSNAEMHHRCCALSLKEKNGGRNMASISCI